eukprot:GHVH01012850.1.p3 GENE.GHVH01012850.1~~GHVH01012850.1.p3  ORF type:complete len:130 (+),score=30.09 GHVH01012850.1:1129-1518(+)
MASFRMFDTTSEETRRQYISGLKALTTADIAEAEWQNAELEYMGVLKTIGNPLYRDVEWAPPNNWDEFIEVNSVTNHRGADLPSNIWEEDVIDDIANPTNPDEDEDEVDESANESELTIEGLFLSSTAA